jgi:hypothetical protein
MYGTCARMIVKPENRQTLADLIKEQNYPNVPGFVASVGGFGAVLPVVVRCGW